MRNQGIGGWIARRARITPNRTAVVFEDASQTYAEMHQRVTLLAHGLLSLGVRSRDRVAFFGPNHLANLENLFACSTLGAIAVPLHYRFSARELTHAINDAGCKVLIFTPKTAAMVDEIRPHLSVQHYVALNGCRDYAKDYEALLASVAEGAEPIDRPIVEDDTCLVIYTSGTTGLNKGVMLSHRNMAANVYNFLSCTDYVSSDVMLTAAPLYRMGGLGTLMPIFFKGATAVILADFDADEVLRLIERYRITLLFNGPRQFADLYRSPLFKDTDLSSIRFCICGGDVVPEWLIQRYIERDITFQHGYGLTEAAPLALLLAEEDTLPKFGSAGLPPLLMDVRVVRDDMTDVQPGQIGELLVRGPNVMQGYWEHPDTTDKVLQDRWLRTGDAARVDAQGYVFILDRIKDAMEIGGTIVYPHEIEGVLMQHPAVDECAVIAFRPEPEQANKAGVFIVPTDDAKVTPDELTSFCEQNLPPERVPARVELVTELPRNSNGKLMRRRLRDKLEGTAYVRKEVQTLLADG